MLREKELKYGKENQDNAVLMLNYISVLPKNWEVVNEEELTSANIWIAALEKILFNQS